MAEGEAPLGPIPAAAADRGATPVDARAVEAAVAAATRGVAALAADEVAATRARTRERGLILILARELRHGSDSASALDLRGSLLPKEH